MTLISLPNIAAIIQMTRIRSTSNDLLSKMRYVRSLAIKTQRELVVSLKPEHESFQITKPAYIEYNLLEDLAGRIRVGGTISADDDDKYVLYEEAAGTICQSGWGDAQASEAETWTGGTCWYYFGGSLKNNGVDLLESTCNVIKFEPSGALEPNNDPNCRIRIYNERLNRQYTLVLFKGGQMILE